VSDASATAEAARRAEVPVGGAQDHLVEELIMTGELIMNADRRRRPTGEQCQRPLEAAPAGARGRRITGDSDRRERNAADASDPTWVAGQVIDGTSR
jgi:hypothetical protein